MYLFIYLFHLFYDDVLHIKALFLKLVSCLPIHKLISLLMQVQAIAKIICFLRCCNFGIIQGGITFILKGTLHPFALSFQLLETQLYY